MTPTPAHIVFDIGQVLLRWNPELLYRELIPDDGERARFFAEVCTPAWNLEQDRGRPWEEGEALLIADHPDQADNIRAWRARWHETVPHALDDSVALMRALIAQGCDVTLLSNFNQHTFAEVQVRFPFLDEPRGRTISAHVGLIKPEPEIYHHHIRAFDLDPAKTLFIDDSATNIHAAEIAGWQGHLFTDATSLQAELRKQGLPV